MLNIRIKRNFQSRSTVRNSNNKLFDNVMLSEFNNEVIRQKGKYVSRKQIMCAYQMVRNVRFSENLACFVFLKHPF